MRTTAERARSWSLFLVCGLLLAAGAGTSAQAAAGQKAPRLAPKGAGPVPAAVAPLEGKSGTQSGGDAEFSQEEGKVTLRLLVKNAPRGSHAVHIHEKGDCSDPEAKSAGAHWNPGGAEHGKWGDTCHLGDIGNIDVDERGEGILLLTTDLWTIGGDPASDILGKSVIVHAQPDDFKTQPTGNAGGRIACGVIQKKN